MAFASKSLAAVEDFLSRPQGEDAQRRLGLAERRDTLVKELEQLRTSRPSELSGTLGRQIRWRR